MKTESVSKIKYLKIWDILRQETDEQHPISTPDLIARLEACGIACDRRTLYRNIEELNENGYEILVKKGKPNGYYVEDRSFDIPEIQILMDAVQAASFITDKKTPVLIDKIAQLAGSQRAEVLKSNIVQFGTVKGSNESIYYSVNEISQAIIWMMNSIPKLNRKSGMSSRTGCCCNRLSRGRATRLKRTMAKTTKYWSLLAIKFWT